jgi:ribose transport system ATP-binding protein
MDRESNLILQGRNLLKTYGPTIAVNEVSIDLHRGEVLALVGANGAGKSTLIKVLSGVVPCDRGEIRIEGSEIDTPKYSIAEARKRGIRVVHQELSLCKNLTVYENFFIELSKKFGKQALNWRRLAKAHAKEALDKVFPDHRIDVGTGLATLSIAQQQMVEIARAVSDPNVKIVILDEPTSALPTEQTQQLQAFIKASARSDISYIYISHRLKEIMALADRTYIMQNGCEKYQCSIGDTSEEDMVSRMGDGIQNGQAIEEEAFTAPPINEKAGVYLDQYTYGKLKEVGAKMYGGEIIALTGLEGNGQIELLQEIFFRSGKKKTGIRIDGKVAYIAGDRKKEGIFPLWSISDNTIISNISNGPLFKFLSTGFVTDLVDKWNGRLQTKCESSKDLITNLSGGNQQKVLIARAMAVDADIILLDDPTRGVDVATKKELYQVFREAAQDGKLVIWRTSDDSELEYCTRLCVMNEGTIVGEFNTEEFDHSKMLTLAFQYSENKNEETKRKKQRQTPLYFFSLIAMIVLYTACCFLQPAVASKFGIELLAVGFSPFIFAALAQTFAIGLGHIDLSVGAFMGLVNVVCATILNRSNGLGLVVLLALLLIYSCMGLLIYWRDIPPIIVTLSMSFVWIGMAYLLQDVPGGQVPSWMVKLFNPSNPILEGVVLWLILFIVLSVLIYRSRYGTALRGFGNNETALRNSGWSKAKAFWATYLIAGLFAMMGGVAQSAITGASDVNASATYTMLTVAAVILGGGYFTGGVVTHVGAVFGGISLTMVSVLLGLLRVSTDFTATIQGLVLILILSLRLVRKEKRQ